MGNFHILFALLGIALLFDSNFASKGLLPMCPLILKFIFEGFGKVLNIKVELFQDSS